MDEQPPSSDDELAARRGQRRIDPNNTPGPGRGKNSTLNADSGQRRVIAAQRQARALQLRVMGVSLAAIAEEVGYADPSGARKAIMAGLKELLPDELRDDARRLELAKLDRLEQANWANALSGDEKAASVILRCSKARREILGIDAPAQVDMRVRREGEIVRVEILDLLNDETLAALRPFQDEMVRLSELRAGAIDVEASDA